MVAAPQCPTKGAECWMRPAKISEINGRLTPKESAMNCCVWPASRNALIVWPSSAVNFCHGVPLRQPCRALRIMSCVLSFGVPRNRWSTLTHEGLSQRCSTKISGDKSPRFSTHATRCAVVRTYRPPGRICPYPPRVLVPIHGMQPFASGIPHCNSNRCSKELLAFDRFRPGLLIVTSAAGPLPFHTPSIPGRSSSRGRYWCLPWSRMTGA